jgi:hypothetical protein
MQFKAHAAPIFSIRAVAVIIAFCAVIIAGASHRALAAPANIAYDELTKFVRTDQTAPQPGTFTADFQAALDAQKPATEHHGLFGSIMNAVDTGKSAMAIFKTGIASRNYYMNGWERSDDVAAQSATIQKPDKNQIIYLNLAKKTYHVVDTSVTPVTSTPPPYQAPPNPQGQQPSPQPGNGKLDISVTSSSLGAQTIEKVQTTGYSQDFKVTASQSTGSCHDGTFETSMVEYLSAYAEPHLATSTAMRQKPVPSAPMPAMMAVKPGCSPKTTMHASGGAQPPGNRLSLWTLIALKGSAQSNQGQMSGGFSTLIERGNVRTLGPADASLFEIPSDFTKEQ